MLRAMSLRRVPPLPVALAFVAAALIAATVLMFPGGMHTPRGAVLGLAIVAVPAVLMVSTRSAQKRYR